MRKIPKPFYDPNIVLTICIDAVKNADLRSRFEGISLDLQVAAKDYDDKAQQSDLFSLIQFNGNDEKIVVGSISKGELKSLYSDNFVSSDMPARSIYEILLNPSTGKLCPFCGFGHIKNLDHYLPKAKFPLYSVVPQNLVPACRDCNMGKMASTAVTKGTQPIHPYYDDDCFFVEQWLFAEVLHTLPATIRFYVKPPILWCNETKERVAAHFHGFALDSRLPVQAATELSAIGLHCSTLRDMGSRQQYVRERAECYLNIHRNSWQTAMTQALAGSEWYCREGFIEGSGLIPDVKTSTRNIQYCLKCEREGTAKDLGLFWCEYHINSDVPEHSIPPYKGIILDGSSCGAGECYMKPTKIYGGLCFCPYHFAAVKTRKP